MKVGIVGWRGMVGSVLLNRMLEEGDLVGCGVYCFSTSNPGGKPPDLGLEIPPLLDAFDIKVLSDMDVVLTCQGSDYTKRIYEELRGTGWDGYWIDAASALRMQEEAVIVLDPVNKTLIDKALEGGRKTFVGGNCTVSLLLLALLGLLKRDLVEWVSTMTYQAASGAGAGNLLELAHQFSTLGRIIDERCQGKEVGALEVEAFISEALSGGLLPAEAFGAPLAGNLLPWIDRPVSGGQTREEWKGMAEANKILGREQPIPIDGICVRVGVTRCHSQAVTIKLRGSYPLEDISNWLMTAHEWMELVPNVQDATLKRLTPAAVTGSLKIAVGRLHKLKLGPEYLALFTVGDQLLWGAAEPLRRMFRIIRDYKV